MAKNFAAIYGSQNDAIALEQTIFLKEEIVRGQVVIPTANDRLLSLSGASVSFSQPVESSPHKSGRHHNNIIKQKTSTEWTLPLFFNIDTALGAASVNEIDVAARLLYKAVFGNEDITAGWLKFNTLVAPNTTFSLFENLDVMAQQTVGCFVEAANASFPGDGQAQIEFSGMAKTVLQVGLGKSIVSNNGGNTVTVAVGEGKQFPVGGKVMIIKDDGVTRSTATPAGSARTVTAVAGDVVTLDGASLADADGSAAPVYLAYFEPVGPFTVIDNPQTGLKGTITIGSLGAVGCVRSAGFNMTNTHEPQDFCYGEEGLGGQLFTPGGRFTTEVSVELNLDKKLVGFVNNLKKFNGESVVLTLGDATGRHLKVTAPKCIFAVPAITAPESGTIPVSLTGNAYQTALDAGDEMLVEFL